MVVESIFGTLAVVFSAIALLPQILKVLRTKSAGDISLWMIWVFLAASSCWMVYGWTIMAWPIIVADTSTFALASFLLYLKLTNK